MRDAIEQAPIGPDADTLRAGYAARDHLDARLNAAAGRFQADGLHEIDGSVTFAAWLRRHCTMTTTTAHRLAVQARKLHRLEVVATAWENGQLSGGQVDAILTNLPERHLDRFADHAPELVTPLAALSAADVAVAMQAWRQRADTETGDDHTTPDPEPVEAPSTLHLSDLLDGYGALDAHLTAQLHAELRCALRLADSGDLDILPAERRADALAVIIRFFLDHQTGHRAGARHRPHLNIVLPADELTTGLDARIVDGPTLDPTTTSVLLCDSVIHRLLAGRSGILDYGRATRTVPIDLWNALVRRDHHCRWPGCDRPAHWADAHHLIYWENGGPTELPNLVVLCRRHHHRAHTKGWTAKLLPDATLEITNPDGHTSTSRPPGPIPQQFW